MTQVKVQFAVCIQDAGYPASLELHKLYRILPDEDAALDGDIRVIDESNEDYLYPADYFIVIALPHDVEQILLNPQSALSSIEKP